MRLRRTLTSVAAIAMLANSAYAVGANSRVEAAYTQSVISEFSHSMIKDTFDKLRYQLSVEWDQEDPSFKQRAQKQFSKDLQNILAQGVSIEEVREYMESSLLTPQARADYQALLESLELQGASAEQAAQASTTFLEDTYMTGSSFSAGGETSFRRVAIILGIIVIAVVTYHLIHDDDDEEEEIIEEEKPIDECEYPMYVKTVYDPCKPVPCSDKKVMSLCEYTL